MAIALPFEAHTAPQLTFATQLFAARTADDVLALIAAHPDAAWRPLGGRENNYGLVNVGADAGDALVERITNGMDALIERGVGRERLIGLETPRQAVERLFGIPEGRLRGMPTGRREELAQALQVTMRDSGTPKRPTVVVRDAGCGQHPDDFERTLLSLNEKNKVDKPYLMGAFGQGGAAAFASCRYALFVARRDPALLAPDQEDVVGWSIIRFNELDENWKHPMYEYLVLPGPSGAPRIPRFPIAELPEEQAGFVGCHFAAFEYGIERYADPVFHSKASLWQLLNYALFDPVYPILIRDERDKALREDRKRALDGIVVSGNATRLAEDKRNMVDYDDSARVELGDAGWALVRYWLLNDAGDRKKNWERMAGYIEPEHAVTITLNGQRQGTMRRDLLNKLALAGVGKEIIIHADCDRLSKRAKWELFSTTRDRIRTDRPLAAELERGIRDAIGSDQTLRAKDRERKERAFARQSVQDAEKIRTWLKGAITTLRSGLREVFRKVISTNTEYQILGDQPLFDETGTVDRPGVPPIDIATLDPAAEPTFLGTINPTVRVPVGGTGVVRLSLDAPDDYISPDGGRGTFEHRITRGAELFQVKQYSALRGGIMRATIQAAPGIPVGAEGQVIFVVTPPNGAPLLTKATIVAVESPKPRAKPAGNRPGPEPGPDVRPYDRAGWLELGNPEDLVAQVEEDPATGATTIHIYKEYPALMDQLRRARVEPEAMAHHQAKFVASMALAAWLQNEEVKKLEPTPAEEALQAELRRAADVFVFSQFLTKDAAE